MLRFCRVGFVENMYGSGVQLAERNVVEDHEWCGG